MEKEEFEKKYLEARDMLLVTMEVIGKMDPSNALLATVMLEQTAHVVGGSSGVDMSEEKSKDFIIGMSKNFMRIAMKAREEFIEYCSEKEVEEWMEGLS